MSSCTVDLGSGQNMVDNVVGVKESALEQRMDVLDGDVIIPGKSVNMDVTEHVSTVFNTTEDKDGNICMDVNPVLLRSDGDQELSENSIDDDE